MGEHLFRNIFDQYGQAENRLTHAFMHVLARNARLARKFVVFATGSAPTKNTSFSFSCQALPGEEPTSVLEEDYAERHGLPDAWIYSENSGWAVVLESKVTASLSKDQLVRHLRMARTRGFEKAHLLVVTADQTKPDAITGLPRRIPASWVSWPRVYEFFAAESRTDLEFEFLKYMRVLEGQMMHEGYEGPPLTKFTGVPFGARHPFNAGEAKVVLRALMAELRPRMRTSRILPQIEGNIHRKPMTGTWDIVRFGFASRGREHTRHPHLAVGFAISSDWSGYGKAWIQLVLPHGARPQYWDRIRDTNEEQLMNALRDGATRLRPLRHHVDRDIWEPKLMLQIYQRHFYARKEWTRDGIVQCDLDTLLGKRNKVSATVKTVPAWLEAVRMILARTRDANFELALQAGFPLSHRSVCARPGFIDVLVRSAEAFEPLLHLLRGSK